MERDEAQDRYGQPKGERGDRSHRRYYHFIDREVEDHRGDYSSLRHHVSVLNTLSLSDSRSLVDPYVTPLTTLPRLSDHSPLTAFTLQERAQCAA